MYSSAFGYPHAFIGPATDIAYTDPVTLPLLSTEGLDVFSVGSEYTRVEKTLRVAGLADASKILDVCVNDKNPSGYTNCSTCYKCLRTLATLDIAGRLSDFSDSFDFDVYRARRMLYLAELLGSSDPLSKEIAEFAKQQNFSFPLLSRLINFLGASPAIRFSIRKLRAVKRLLADRSTPSPLPQGSTLGLPM